MPKCSIIICSLNRPESLARCLKSIEKQDYKDYEIILCQEEGRLVELKNNSLKKAKGDIIIFIDDDIVVTKYWLKSIVDIFDFRKDIVGITGPTIVTEEYLKNRDVFRGGLIKWFYNWFFLEGKVLYPGRITSCGANTLGANYINVQSSHAQEVDFLEPCQMAIRKKSIELAGGIDTSFEGIGEWFDVDLCYRLKRWGKLIYHPAVNAYHCPINDTTTNKRQETASRYHNYCRWADKYVEKTFKHKLYRLFLWIYFKWKAFYP